MVCLGTAAGDIGMISLVVFTIYSRHSMTLEHAAWAGLIALGGGLLQTALSIALWPFRGHDPERQSIGDFYQELARTATIPPDPYGAPAASRHSTRAQEALSSLVGNHSVEADRLFALVSQGFPQLVRVSSDVVRPDNSRVFPERMPVICQIRMVNETPLVPDLERLEEMIADETSISA